VPVNASTRGEGAPIQIDGSPLIIAAFSHGFEEQVPMPRGTSPDGIKRLGSWRHHDGGSRRSSWPVGSTGWLKMHRKSSKKFQLAAAAALTHTVYEFRQQTINTIFHEYSKANRAIGDELLSTPKTVLQAPLLVLAV